MAAFVPLWNREHTVFDPKIDHQSVNFNLVKLHDDQFNIGGNVVRLPNLTLINSQSDQGLKVNHQERKKESERVERWTGIKNNETNPMLL